MRTFATPDDLQDSWRVMDASEGARAEALLLFVSAKMHNYMARHGVAVYESDEVQTELLKGICVAVVRRAMGDRSNPGEDVVAWGGPTVYSSSGDVYFTTGEKDDMLGTARRQRVGSLRPDWGSDE